jgi:hypothetical protein
MKSSDGRWQVTRSAPVRADAEGVFVPVDELAGAAIGDHVVISGSGGDDERTGVIAELMDGEDQAFFRLELD